MLASVQTRRPLPVEMARGGRIVDYSRVGCVRSVIGLSGSLLLLYRTTLVRYEDGPSSGCSPPALVRSPSIRGRCLAPIPHAL